MQVVVCIQLWIFKGRRSKRRPTNSLHAFAFNLFPNERTGSADAKAAGQGRVAFCYKRLYRKKLVCSHNINLFSLNIKMSKNRTEKNKQKWKKETNEWRKCSRKTDPPIVWMFALFLPIIKDYISVFSKMNIPGLFLLSFGLFNSTNKC